MKHVTRAQAEDAAKVIGEAFGAGDSQPKVYERDDREGYYAVVWEEGSPFEWSYLMDGGFDEEMFSLIHPEFIPDRVKAVQMSTRGAVKLPEGVVAEAINTYSVALFTEEEY